MEQHSDHRQRLGRLPHIIGVVLSFAVAFATACTPEPADSPAEAAVQPQATAAPNGELTLWHFDVGQADATLIQGPEASVLIDAGDWQRNDVVDHLTTAGVEEIDLIILTHPHADHIGQVPQVLDAFEVTEVWMTGWEHDTRTFERTLDAVLESDVGYHEPRAGETIEFGDLVIEVINPVEPLEDVHDNLAVRVVFGEFAAIYTGDAETHHEAEMIERGHDLNAQVLQLGHHGSRTSSSREFLEAIGPEVASYSAEVDSRYGHPHAEVVERVANLGITLLGTAVHGTIVVRTDGDTFTVETEGDGEPEPGVVTDVEPAGGCIDINTASLNELQQIVHVGESRAQQIIDLRPFESVADLDRVDGIGPGRLNDIEEEGLACIE